MTINMVVVLSRNMILIGDWTTIISTFGEIVYPYELILKQMQFIR